MTAYFFCDRAMIFSASFDSTLARFSFLAPCRSARAAKINHRLLFSAAATTIRTFLATPLANFSSSCAAACVLPWRDSRRRLIGEGRLIGWRLRPWRD
jgi:hypothetical protein